MTGEEDVQIERITTALRPRNHWETIDLGFNMAQRWYLPLLILWLSSALPIYLLLCALPFINLFWTGVIIWWLKPLYEQVLLFYISRALFGEYPPLREVVRQYWSISKQHLIPMLSWRRFSFSRSFNNPVSMLEGLKGKQRSERLQVLHYTHKNTSQWLTFFCYNFELIIWFAFCLLLLSLLPENNNWIDFDKLMDFEDRLGGIISYLFYLLAMGIMAPFYVCAGFSLYLTRRTELEGWDIELNFKRISERLNQSQSTTAIVFFYFAVFIGSASLPNDAQAMGQTEAKNLIEEVLEQEEFGKVETKKKWQLISEEEKENEEFNLEWLSDLIKDIAHWFNEVLPGIASVFEFILWAAVIILLLYLITRYTSWLQWLGLPKFQTGKKYKPPTHLFGLEVKSDSLPEDVIDTVRTYIKEGNFRQALSLLYRATLIQLIHIHQLEVSESATEGECQRLVESSRPDEESHYFSLLTRTWLLLAYAHEPPEAEQLFHLCDRWPEFYEVQHGT